MSEGLPEIKRILVPTAFSRLATHAARYARRVAPALGAQVHVLHVVEPPIPVLDPVNPTTAVSPVTSAGELMRAGQESLERFVAEHLPGLSPAPLATVTMGLPGRELVEYSLRHSIDLIIMGTHATGVIRRIVFGSVSKTVLEAAPCPVLLVPLGAMEHPQTPGAES